MKTDGDVIAKYGGSGKAMDSLGLKVLNSTSQADCHWMEMIIFMFLIL